MPAKTHIFVSYSHQDASYLAKDSLLGYLRGLEQDRLAQVDGVGPGNELDGEYRLLRVIVGQIPHPNIRVQPDHFLFQVRRSSRSTP